MPFLEDIWQIVTPTLVVNRGRTVRNRKVVSGASEVGRAGKATARVSVGASLIKEDREERNAREVGRAAREEAAGVARLARRARVGDYSETAAR